MADQRLRLKDNTWRRHVFKHVCDRVRVLESQKHGSKPGSDLGQTRVRPDTQGDPG